MSTETSTYDEYRTTALGDIVMAEEQPQMWTRDQLLASAQVHATLAVAAAYRIDYEETVEIAGARADLAAQLVEAKNFAEGYAATADDLLRLVLPMFTDAEALEFEASGALPTRDLAKGRTDAFTGSERADEVGA